MNIVRVATVVGLWTMVSLARRMYKTPLNPVSALAAPYAVILAYQELALSFLPFGMRASALILSTSGVMLCGAAVHRGTGAPDRAIRVIDLRSDRVRLAAGVAWACVLIAFVYAVVLANSLLFGQLAPTNQYLARALYLRSSDASVALRMLHGATLCGALYMAFYFASTRGRKRTPTIVFLALAAAQAWVSASRAAFMLIVLMFLLTNIIINPHRFAGFSVRRGLAVFVTLAFTLSVTSAVLFRRGSNASEVRKKGQYTVVGGPSALSSYLDGTVQVNFPETTLITFGGLVELIARDSARGVGIFTNSIEFEQGVQASSTNVYTWYLPLLRDFGYVGVLAIILALGLLLTPLALRTMRGLASPMGAGVLVTFMLLLVFSSVAPLTYYNFWYGLLFLSPWLNLVFARQTSFEAGHASSRAARGTPTNASLRGAHVL